MSNGYTLLERILEGVRRKADEPLRSTRVRDVETLVAIRDRLGSKDSGPFLGALIGEVNAEEYLLLEKINEN